MMAGFEIALAVLILLIALTVGVADISIHLAESVIDRWERRIEKRIDRMNELEN